MKDDMFSAICYGVLLIIAVCGLSITMQNIALGRAIAAIAAKGEPDETSGRLG